MASESLRPTPASSGGGYAKYLIGLLLLLGGGLGIFLATRSDEPPVQPATPPPPKNAERSTALAQEPVQLPVEEEEDAGAPQVAEQPKKPRRGNGGGDPWSCQGDIPTAEIKQLLADRQPAIRACYEKRLRVNNTLQGSLKLQIRIGNDGKVDATRAGGSLRDPEVFSCVQTLTKKWTFPAPSGGSCAVIEAPYNFTPKP